MFSSWRQEHDDKNNFIETFDGEHTVKETAQTKYLGCILSKDGTNTKNIKMKVNKAIGIRKVIQTLIKGLGKYTVEGGIIYFKSLLRGSILYATESMVNLKEKDVKLLERAEEATLRDLVKTESSALHNFYLFRARDYTWKVRDKTTKTYSLKAHINAEREFSYEKSV